MEQPNKFDRLLVELDEIYRKWPLQELSRQFPDPCLAETSYLQAVYATRFLPERAKDITWKVLRRAQLDQAWFNRFAPYWSHVLGGRPLAGVQDLYFLRGVYRMRFQHSYIPDTTDARGHLTAWQRPEVVYQLLDRVYKESLSNELNLVALMNRFVRRTPRVVLEFGSATAPLTQTLFDFGYARRLQRILIADIKTVAFHYAAYKFRRSRLVQPILLEAADGFRLQLDGLVDTIFCITVFEHLNEPLVAIRTFWEKLRPGGLLIFDYIKGEGAGLDTRQAVRERESVLDFIEKNFEVVSGNLVRQESLPVTVARKPR